MFKLAEFVLTVYSPVERLTRMSGFTESTHEEQEADAIADFWSAQASSEVGMIGSVQESDCSNISRKLQVIYLIEAAGNRENG